MTFGLRRRMPFWPSTFISGSLNSISHRPHQPPLRARESTLTPLKSSASIWPCSMTRRIFSCNLGVSLYTPSQSALQTSTRSQIRKDSLKLIIAVNHIPPVAAGAITSISTDVLNLSPRDTAPGGRREVSAIFTSWPQPNTRIRRERGERRASPVSPRPARVGSVGGGNLHPSTEPQLALLDLGLCLLAECVLATGAVVGRVLFGVCVSTSYHNRCHVVRLVM